MIIGRIVGKITTNRFEILITQKVKKFEYLQVHHNDYGYVLCQLVEIIKEKESTKGICTVLGYPDDNGNTKMIREPFDPETEVLIAEDSFIQKVVKLETSKQGAYVGMLEGRDIKVYLDLQKLLTKHVAVLAKSGAGKSYCVGVLLEEIMEKKIPLLIIDPHGEYHSLKHKSDEDSNRFERYGIKPKGYLRRIKQYGDPEHNPDCIPLTLSEKMDPHQLQHLLPKISATQEAILYSAMKNNKGGTLSGLVYALEMEESPAKFSILQQLQHLIDLKLFSNAPVALNELIQVNRASIINLRGIAPEMQQLIVYKLLSDVFEARKKGQVPPFFCVIEEAHNYCPEKSFGNSKASHVIRTIASEGRKFGMGLAVISQRPARVEKSVLSQVTTQIILKVTNPNDLKAVSQSVEGLTSESADEMQHLSIGTALVTGVVDMPLFVNIRPRKSKHGGEAVDILEQTKGAELFEEIKEFSESNIIALIEPSMSKRDVELIYPDDNITVLQVPAALFTCQDNATFHLLIELENGEIVSDVTEFTTKKLPDLDKLSARELQVLEKAFFSGTFTIEEFCAKTGFSIDVAENIETLVEKNYIIKQEGGFKINDAIVLSKLSKHACYQQPEYKASPAERKVNKGVKLDDVKKQVEKFTSVTNVQDCWIIKYQRN